MNLFKDMVLNKVVVFHNCFHFSKIQLILIDFVPVTQLLTNQNPRFV